MLEDSLLLGMAYLVMMCRFFFTFFYFFLFKFLTIKVEWCLIYDFICNVLKFGTILPNLVSLRDLLQDNNQHSEVFRYFIWKKKMLIFKIK